MRDSRIGLPQILEVGEQDGQWFIVVRLEREGRSKRFRFAVTKDSCLAAKRLLDMRPFDPKPGLAYRHFFVPSVQRLDDERALMATRIEQGAEGMEFDIEAPRDLVKNLLWFARLDNWAEAEHLAVSDSE